MPFRLKPGTLEPENGDYIAFLKEIEKNNSRVSGLTVTPESAGGGMPAVQYKDEDNAGQNVVPYANESSTVEYILRSLEGRQNKGNALRLLLFGLLAALGAGIAGMGVTSFVLGVMDNDMEFFGPFGMICTFAGAVLYLSYEKKFRRLRGQRK
jgi:hypothetical protein